MPLYMLQCHDFIPASDLHKSCVLIPRKLQVSVAPDLASKGGQGVSNSSNIKIKGEMDDYIQSDTKVCCPCGSSLETESMIKVILIMSYSGCSLICLDRF